MIGKSKPGRHIDPATGRNKRDKSPLRSTEGDGAPMRQIGTARIVSRAAWRRDQVTGGTANQQRAARRRGGW